MTQTDDRTPTGALAPPDDPQLPDGLIPDEDLDMVTGGLTRPLAPEVGAYDDGRMPPGPDRLDDV